MVYHAKWPILGVLTLVYVMGELSHFLLGIVTRPMSQDIKYGDIECINNPAANDIVKDIDVPCYKAKYETMCDKIGTLNETDVKACSWDYSGLGIQYQILAGPAFIGVFTISGILIGLISDRVSRKLVVTICLGVLTLSTLLTGLATQYWQLVILRMLVGAGESSFAPACSSMISDLFSQSKQGMALGIFNWGIYFGYGLSYLIGNYVTAANIYNQGWRFSYYVAGIFGLLIVCLIATTVKEPERGSKKVVEVVDIDGISNKNKDSKSLNSNFNDLSSFNRIRQTMLSPVFILLTIAACIRHTAGFTWAYNTQQYFLNYFPNTDLGLWITACSIFGGAIGVASGGLASDKLMKKMGLKARLYVLAGSMVIACPFAVGVITFSPPYAFYSLLLSYFFAEMWFGVLFAILVEIIPSNVQSTSIAIFLFIMNNVGGNAPVLVTPLRRSLGYRNALYIMYPGFYLLSALLFFLTSFFVRNEKNTIMN